MTTTIKRRKNNRKKAALNFDTNVLKDGCLVNLSVGLWAARAKVKDDIYQEEIKKNKDILRTVQDLLDNNGTEDLKKIRSIYTETYNYLQSNLLPCPIRALNFVPKSKVEEIDKYLESQRERFTNKVIDFVNTYDQHIKSFQKKHKQLFKADKYPTVDRLKSKFYFDWSFRTLSVPNGKTLPNDIYQREVEKAKEEMQEIVNMTMEVVKKEFLIKMENLKTYTADGKIPKKTITSINNLLDKYDDLWSGFIGHEDLKKIIEKIRKKTSKINPDNESEDYIGKIEKQTKAIIKSIDSLPEFESKRALDY